MCTPLLPGPYMIFYWRKREELIQFTVPQYTRPELRLLFNKTSQKPSGNISRNWLYLFGGNQFVTELLLDKDLINLCCFLCLTLTLSLIKQIILSYFCVCSLRYLLQIIWNNWIIFMHLHLWKPLSPSLLLMFTLLKWGGSCKKGERL